MPPSTALSPYICARCVRAKRPRIAAQTSTSIYHIATATRRRYAQSSAARKEDEGTKVTEEDRAERRDGASENGKQDDDGAMTRRLRDMSEEALELGGRSAQRTVSEAGFSEDLKRQLEERIASANFRAEHRNVFAEVGLPSSAGRHTRDIATADAWTGTESIHDASLRMLNDAHRPLKVPGGRRSGTVVQMPRTVDTGRGKTAGQGVRLANARDRSGIYSSIKDGGLDEQERQQRFQELKDRFSSHARSVVPGTVQGLAALANERIEDAIARGQFKNIANRGKAVERDYNASSPFIDTTEYFLNKMIQKQEIVPPWIEKQQELVATANKFRSRLRAEWKRHAARMIASKGGSLQEQVKRAEAYAKAELIVNPSKKKKEVLSTVDSDGNVSQISLSGELKVPSPASPGTALSEDIVAEKLTVDPSEPPSENASDPSPSQISVPLPTVSPSTAPALHPFRDPAWESTEHAYHALAITDLNSKTRSYNLQAPDLAKKPYFSLARELNACYADVAPQLPSAILERAIKPVRKMEGFGQSLAKDGGVVSRFVGEKVKVRDERVEKQYGFRQFWKDVMGGGGS